MEKANKKVMRINFPFPIFSNVAEKVHRENNFPGKNALPFFEMSQTRLRLVFHTGETGQSKEWSDEEVESEPSDFAEFARY